MRGGARSFYRKQQEDLAMKASRAEEIRSKQLRSLRRPFQANPMPESSKDTHRRAPASSQS